MSNVHEFHVIDVDTKEPILGHNRRPVVFQEAHMAKAYAQTASMVHARKLKIVRVSDNDAAWKRREQERFATGYYTKVPWINEPWFKGSIGETEHFVRVSKKNRGMVAYIENHVKGALDTATRIRPGTYLSRFYADKLTAPQIRDLATAFAAKYGGDNEVKFATTASAIERVYRHGPTSCMSLASSRYATRVHPVRAYADAGGDLAVAYIERKGEITARAVVWPEKKIYVRRYGDGIRLEKSLIDLGYKPGSLVGAKLARIPVVYNGNDYFVCPYLDNDSPYVVDDGKHLIISPSVPGAMPAHSTCGIIARIRPACADCGETHGIDIHRWADEPDRLVCGNCFTRLGYRCAGSDLRYRHAANVLSMAGGYLWSRQYFRDHGFTDRVTGRRFSNTGSQRQCPSCNGHYLPSEAWDITNPKLCWACGESDAADKRKKRK